MKFGQQLRLNQVTEWKGYYVDYRSLKRLLYALAPPELQKMKPGNRQSVIRGSIAKLRSSHHDLLSNNSNNVVNNNNNINGSSSNGFFGNGGNGRVSLLSSDEVHIGYGAGETFGDMLRREAGKANSFYLEELARLDERLELLLVDLRQHTRHSMGGGGTTEEEDDEADAARRGRWTMESIRRALRELYRRMVLLQNFTQLNYTAVVKITKKHRKITSKMQQLDDKKRFQVFQDGSINGTRVSSESSNVRSSRGYLGGSGGGGATIDEESGGDGNHSSIGGEGEGATGGGGSGGGGGGLSDESGFVLESMLGSEDAHIHVEEDAFLARELPLMEFVKATELLKRISAIEDAFCHWYTQGDVLAARSQLLAKQRIDYDWRMFHSGLHFGVVFVLLIWVVWDAIVDGMMHPHRGMVMWQSKPFLIYRGLASFVLLIWCIGVNLYVWNKARINYLYIFTLDPELTMNYSQAFTLACNVTIFFFCSFLLFNKVDRQDFPDWIPAAYYPAITFLVFILILIFPLNHRLHLLKTVANLILSPFVPVTFYTSYIADVLTSLVKPLVDVAFSTCFVFSGAWISRKYELSDQTVCNQGETLAFIVTPVIIALPLWIRLMQCLRRYRDTHMRWPHLGNAGKYAVSQTVVLFGAFHPHFKSNSGAFDIYQSLWVVSLVISTLYTYSWDVGMDWGLMQKGQRGLRSHLMFSRPWVYYLVIFADLFLRFSWTLTLLPNSFIPFLQTTAPLVDLFLALLEVMRRTMWGFFRLEWEHLSNTEQYRSVNFIPLHFDLRGHKEEEKYPGWQVALELVVISGIVIGLAVAAALSGPVAGGGE